jgi:hypothetical protein
MSALLVMVLLGVAGAPLAVRLAGPWAEAVFLAPLLGAGYLAAGATVEVALGGTPFGDAVVALVVGALLPILGPTSRALRAHRVHRPEIQQQEVLLLLVPMLVLSWTLSTLRRTQIGWDGRSIWFFHARMLLGGQDVFFAQAHAFPFSHPDYPPLVPAAISFGWGLSGSIDYRAGQLVVAALTGCATVLVGVAMARALAASHWLAPLVAAVCVALCYGVWDVYGSNGMVDPLTAALFLAAAIYALLAPPGVMKVRLAMALLVLASAVKNEGLVFSLIVLVLLAIRQLLAWRRIRSISPEARLRGFGIAFGLMLLWPLVVQTHGLAISPIAGGHIPGVGPDPVHRLGVALEALGPILGTVMIGLGGLAAVAILNPRDARWRVFGFLAAELGATVALLTAYVMGPFEIHWWLLTSLDRTDMVLRAGGLLAAVYAAVAAGRLLVEGMHVRRRRAS